MATWWTLTFEGEPTEADFQRVSEMAAQGFTSGQLIPVPGSGDEEGPAAGVSMGRQSPRIARRTEELLAAGVADLAAARWQAYAEQARGGQCECCADMGDAHNDRPCIVCGHTREG